MKVAVLLLASWFYSSRILGLEQSGWVKYLFGGREGYAAAIACFIAICLYLLWFDGGATVTAVLAVSLAAAQYATAEFRLGSGGTIFPAVILAASSTIFGSLRRKAGEKWGAAWALAFALAASASTLSTLVQRTLAPILLKIEETMHLINCCGWADSPPPIGPRPIYTTTPIQSFFIALVTLGVPLFLLRHAKAPKIHSSDATKA